MPFRALVTLGLRYAATFCRVLDGYVLMPFRALVTLGQTARGSEGA